MEERICLFGADIVEKKAEIHAHIFREQMRKTVLCVMKFFRTGLQGDILRIIFVKIYQKLVYTLLIFGFGHATVVFDDLGKDQIGIRLFAQERQRSVVSVKQRGSASFMSLTLC